jgi:RNA polymerase-binding transcription factor DksA
MYASAFQYLTACGKKVMASSKKKASKKPVKKKASAKAVAKKKPVVRKASKPARKAPVRAAKPAASAKKPARVGKPAKQTPVRKGSSLNHSDEMLRILGNNHKSRKLDPFTRAQKEKLLQLRDAMVDSMAGVAKDNLRSRAEGSEASAFGMHQADAGSDAYDRDFALSLLSQEQDALYEIDQALKRVELGTYGVCEMSGKAISKARLEAIPFARFTVECQSQLEKQNKASRVRQSVTSLFGLTDEEKSENEEEEAKTDDSKD